jgi:hypothetical protein
MCGQYCRYLALCPRKRVYVMFDVMVIFQDNSHLRTHWNTCPVLGMVFSLHHVGILYSVAEMSEDRKTVWAEEAKETKIWIHPDDC